MYCTLSKDGTIALRCQRTSRLWYLFKPYLKLGKTKKDETIVGLSQVLRHVNALKLSLHGYIIVVG